MLRVVCLKWGESSTKDYSEKQVNWLYRGLKRHVKQKFSLCCITDDPSGIQSDVDIYEMPEVCRRLTKVPGKHFAKLFLFSDEFSSYINEKFIYLDMDVVITGDISTIADSDASLTILTGVGKKRGLNKLRYILKKRQFPRYAPVNSSVMVVKPYDNSDIWRSFDPQTSPKIIEAKRIVGTDQAWVYLTAGDRLETIGKEDGIYTAGAFAGHSDVPNNAKIMVFTGHWRTKPWMDAARERHPWLGRYAA